MSVLGNNLLAQYYAQNQRRLPAGYREVEYLEATGTQYIDTGITPLVGDSFDMSADWNAFLHQRRNWRVCNALKGDSICTPKSSTTHFSIRKQASF
jgi:hypothetical protein